MREILFKAKRKDNDEWVEGYLLKDEVTGQYFIHASGNSVNESDKVNEEGCLQFVAFEVDENTICQYTGLTDDKECKIWEHDVVVYSWTNGQDEVETENTAVSYDKHGFTPFIWDYDCDDCCLYNEILEIEVIGNIFDNPDL